LVPATVNHLLGRFRRFFFFVIFPGQPWERPSKRHPAKARSTRPHWSHDFFNASILFICQKTLNFCIHNLDHPRLAFAKQSEWSRARESSLVFSARAVSVGPGARPTKNRSSNHNVSWFLLISCFRCKPNFSGIFLSLANPYDYGGFPCAVDGPESGHDLAPADADPDMNYAAGARAVEEAALAPAPGVFCTTESTPACGQNPLPPKSHRRAAIKASENVTSRLPGPFPSGPSPLRRGQSVAGRRHDRVQPELARRQPLAPSCGTGPGSSPVRAGHAIP